METWLAYFGEKHGGAQGRARRMQPDALVHAGWETRTAADRYHWDGMRRGAHASHPYVVFQVTLDGCGTYQCGAAAAGGGVHLVPPGRAFAALVPSEHCYFLAPETASWTFFWVLVRHPYVVARIAERQRGAPAMAVLPVTAGDTLIERAVTLFEGGFADCYEEELALFSFLVEFERRIATRPGASPGSGAEEADALREEARRLVLEDLARPVDVAGVARLRGMSRSRYSHHFKAVTGASPAHFMAGIRLQEVARRLVHTDLTLSQIALETGFADANHLCKAFRRRYHQSPGVFRRQMR